MRFLLMASCLVFGCVPPPAPSSADGGPICDGDGGPVDDASPAGIDAGDIVVEPEYQCPGDECGGGRYTFCRYEHLGEHNARDTVCGNPEQIVGSYTCGACPADPVCDEPCDLGDTDGFVMCDDDPYENRPRQTVCRAQQPVWGDGFSCGECSPPSFSIQAQNDAVLTPPSSTSPVVFYIHSHHGFTAEVPVRAYVTDQGSRPMWTATIAGSNPPDDHLVAHVGPDNPNGSLRVVVDVTSAGVAPVPGTAVYLVHDAPPGTEGASTAVLYGHPGDF